MISLFYSYFLTILSIPRIHGLPHPILNPINARSPQTNPAQNLPSYPSHCFPASFHLESITAQDCNSLIAATFQSPKPETWSYNVSTANHILPQNGIFGPTTNNGICLITLQNQDPTQVGTFSLSDIGKAASRLVTDCVSGKTEALAAGGTAQIGVAEQGFYVYVDAGLPPDTLQGKWNGASGEVAQTAGQNAGNIIADTTLQPTLPGYKEKRKHDPERVPGEPVYPYPDAQSGSANSIPEDTTLQPTLPDYKQKRASPPAVDAKGNIIEDTTLQPTLPDYKEKRAPPGTVGDMTLQPTVPDYKEKRWHDSDRIYEKGGGSIIEDTTLQPTLPDYKGKRDGV